MFKEELFFYCDFFFLVEAYGYCLTGMFHVNGLNSILNKGADRW